MSNLRVIKSLVAPHYPYCTPDGRTIMRTEPPCTAVLVADGSVERRCIDEVPDMKDTQNPKKDQNEK